jgi:hypothetical protein
VPPEYVCQFAWSDIYNSSNEPGRMISVILLTLVVKRYIIAIRKAKVNIRKMNMAMKKSVIIFSIFVLLLAVLATAGCASDTRSAKSSLKQFFTYQKYNQWEQVWGMLHPDSQATWDSEDEFILKYDQPLINLISYELEKAETVSSWNSRSLQKTYSDVVEIPVTLTYSRQYGETQRSTIVHAVKYNGNWKFFLNK